MDMDVFIILHECAPLIRDSSKKLITSWTDIQHMINNITTPSNCKVLGNGFRGGMVMLMYISCHYSVRSSLIDWLVLRKL